MAETYEQDHYAYCKSPECPGCLPSHEALTEAPLFALWGEMLARCIAQTPETKTRAGALSAIRNDDSAYRERARRIRAERFSSL